DLRYFVNKGSRRKIIIVVRLRFKIFLPFLIVDLVVASATISMGMLMLPPAVISLPFKLLLFVLVDGWTLIVMMLMESFGTVGVT
ncbi:MAG: hypothetical protein AAFP90_23585, partial [Planctomycetota bacterium]